jgi:hypothetical protein
MPDLDTQIEQLLREFSDRLRALVSAAAVQSVELALGPSHGTRRPGRPRKPRGKAPGRAPAGGKPVRRSGKRERRTQADMEALQSAILDALRKSGPSRVEELADVLGMKTSALALPLRKMRAVKIIGTQGVKRATTYSAV